MLRPRNTTVFEWLFCLAILLIGMGMLGMYVFHSLYGTTPEYELTKVEGVATAVEISEYIGRYGARTEFLKFSVSGYKTEYSSSRPNYQQVLDAVQGDEKLQLWVSTKQETLFPRQGWVPLYKMCVGDDVVLSYDAALSRDKGGAFAVLVVGSVLLAIGTLGLFQCFRQR